MPIAAGQIINDRYRIDAKLGEGGMGAVYRAFDLRLARPCALKALRLDHLPSEAEAGHADAPTVRRGASPPPVSREKAAEQFRREAQLLARLDHPNLPAVTDYFGAGAEWYLVMTLVEGRDLATVLEEAGGTPLPEAQVLAWLGQVMDALAYCHGKGVIHRDVKPANMILTPEGKVYLVDFGIAKPDDPTGKTTIGARAATPGYSPPEQYAGGGRTDARSDIYALGATMYALLAGHEPPGAVDRMMGAELAPLHVLAPDVSPQAEAAVYRAMAIQPAERFQGVAEMKAALTAQTPQVAPDHAEAALCTERLGAATGSRQAQPSARAQLQRPAPSVQPQGIMLGPRALGAIGVVGLAGLLLLIVALARPGQPVQPPALTPSAQVVVAPGTAASTQTPLRTLPPAAPTQTPLRTLPPAAPTPTPVRSPTPKSPLLLTLAPGVTMDLVRVPAGEFTMGSAASDSEANDDEKPQHTVRLDEYLIGKTEVTVAQFRAFVDATGYRTTAEREGWAFAWAGSQWDRVQGADWRHPRGPGAAAAADDHPVTQVSWDDAVAFCAWLGQHTGRAVRLPTEAEWEKAARGTDGRKYPWGNAAPAGHLLNYADRNWQADWADKAVDDGYELTAPVGHYPAGASPCGALDMAGNVWEWTGSLYKPYPYRSDDGREDAQSRDARVLRGGSFDDFAWVVRAAFRVRLDPDIRVGNFGLRVCASPI